MVALTTWTIAQEPLPIAGVGRREVVLLLPGYPLPAKIPGKYRAGEKCSTEGTFHMHVQITFFFSSIIIIMLSHLHVIIKTGHSCTPLIFICTSRWFVVK